MSPELFAQFGLSGLVLGWMLLRTDRRLEAMEGAINRLTRAQLMTLLSRRDLSGPMREEANTMLQDLRLPVPPDLLS